MSDQIDPEEVLRVFSGDARRAGLTLSGLADPVQEAQAALQWRLRRFRGAAVGMHWPGPERELRRRTSVFVRPLVELLECHEDDCYCADGDWWTGRAEDTCHHCHVERLPCACPCVGYGDAACWRAGDPIYVGRP